MLGTSLVPLRCRSSSGQPARGEKGHPFRDAPSSAKLKPGPRLRVCYFFAALSFLGFFVFLPPLSFAMVSSLNCRRLSPSITRRERAASLGGALSSPGRTAPTGVRAAILRCARGQAPRCPYFLALSFLGFLMFFWPLSLLFAIASSLICSDVSTMRG